MPFRSLPIKAMDSNNHWHTRDSANHAKQTGRKSMQMNHIKMFAHRHMGSGSLLRRERVSKNLRADGRRGYEDVHRGIRRRHIQDRHGGNKR